MTEQTPVPPPPPPPPPASPGAPAPTSSGSVPPPPPPPPPGGSAPVVSGDGPTGGGGGGRGRRTAIIGGVVAALVLGGGFGAYAVYDRLSGGGTQPHDVLPASTQVYLRVDLDPSASQKVDLFKLLRKVPDLADELGVKSEGTDIRELVFPELLAGECEDVDYEKDVEPWLGDRIGVGANVEDRTLLIAVQTTDEKASRAGIKQLFDCADEDYGIAYVDGYAIVAPKQAQVDRAVAATAKASLGDSSTFTADFDQLGDQGIASAWADLGALAKLPEAKEALGDEIDRLADAGTVATTLRADGDAIELALLGGPAGDAEDKGKATALGALPADTVAALSISGVGDQVAEGFDAFVKELDSQFSGLTGGAAPSASADTIAATEPVPATPTVPAPTADDPFGGETDPFGGGTDPFGGGTDPFGGGLGGFGVQDFLDRIEAATGFALPDDLETLFGDSLTLTVGSENLETLPTVSGPEGFSALDVALALSSEQAPALDLVQRIAALASDAGIPLVTSPTDDGAVLATNQGAADAIVDPKGSLGDAKAFRSVIPDGDTASGGLYVDIGTILDTLLEADPPADIRSDIESAKALSALGISMGRQDDRSLARLRVSFR